MTRPSTVNKVTATGNGVRRTFSFSPIVIFADSELEVVTRVTATGVETLRSLGTTSTTYSISIVANGYPATGSIDFPASGGTLLPSTEEIVIRAVLSLRQDTDLEAGDYSPEVQEEQFDRFMATDQQQQDQLDRSLGASVGTPATIDMELPPLITGNLFIRLKSDLTGWEMVGLTGTCTAVASDAIPQDTSLVTGVPGTSGDFSRADHTHEEDDDILNAVNIHNALNFT